MTESERGRLSDADRSRIASVLHWGGATSFGLLTIGLLIGLVEPAVGRVKLGTVLVHAGIVALLATPVLRVVTAAWAYWRAGQRLYVGLCCFSLIVIAISVAIGLFYPASRQ